MFLNEPQQLWKLKRYHLSIRFVYMVSNSRVELIIIHVNTGIKQVCHNTSKCKSCLSEILTFHLLYFIYEERNDILHLRNILSFIITFPVNGWKLIYRMRQASRNNSSITSSHSSTQNVTESAFDAINPILNYLWRRQIGDKEFYYGNGV